LDKLKFDCTIHVITNLPIIHERYSPQEKTRPQANDAHYQIRTRTTACKCQTKTLCKIQRDVLLEENLALQEKLKELEGTV